jgi:hypothetical protein
MIKQKLVSAKNSVVAHKQQILMTVAVVSTAVAAIEVRAIQQHNQFLKDNDLYETYYASDEI